jgi:uncharacterized protein YdhG (YjbR/CyaY superfamily)
LRHEYSLPMPRKVPAIPKSVALYYRKVPESHKEVMYEMRTRILEVVPKSEEVISYGMPAFRIGENIVAGIMAHKGHVGFYPFSGRVVGLFKRELQGFKTTKSAIHIPLTRPLSKTLIRKLIRARISQCPVKQGRINLGKYEKLDGHWRSIGIAAPARRGLVDNKLLQLNDLRRITKEDLKKVHGMGPKAMKLIEADMKRKSIKFKAK